jgi:hypothetical protein
MALNKVLIVTAVAASMALAACGTTRTTSVSTTTVGQELSDLKQALDSGIIKKSEYEKKRKQILRGK